MASTPAKWRNWYMSHLIKLLVITLFVFALIPITAYSNTFVPNSFNDNVDSNPGDGLCLTSTNVCTLRAAIQESNALSGSHTVLLAAGTYVLSVAGRNEEDSLTGDLDITANISIEGKGAANTTINGSQIDRVLDVKKSTVNLKNLAITGGAVKILDVNGSLLPGGLGGGILLFESTLNIDNVWVYGNNASGMGGGIFSLLSSLNAQHSMLYSNNSSAGAGMAVINGNTVLNESFILSHPSSISTPSTFINPGGTFLGGGIYNFGNLTITKSVLYQNTAESDGGAIYHGLGKLLISNSTIANNVAKRNGGGIYYRMGEIGKSGLTDNTPSLVNVSIVNNIALHLDNSADPLPGFVPDFTQFPTFNNNGFNPNIDFNIPEGDHEGGIGGGGIFVAGQYGQGQQKVSLTVANSIIANNYGDLTDNPALDDCKSTADGEVLSFGNNVDSDPSLGCNFTHVNDLTTGIDLKLIAFDIFDIVNPTVIPNLTQSQFNKLIPNTQLFEADSPLRDAANDAYCPGDDQRGRTRPVIGCDIGAYEFLPPVASPMQFVAKPNVAVDSAFMISDPAGKAVIFEVVSQPSQGSIVQPGGSSVSNWTYTANTSANGNDQFTFKACFSTGECSNTATIGFKIITEPAVTDTVSIDIVSEIGGNASEIDIVNEAELMEGLEDTDYTFPVGAIFFSVENIPVSSPDFLVVELQLPLGTEIPVDAVVRKLDNTGVWRTLANTSSTTESTGVIDSISKTITLTLLDNDIFDSNPASGIIRDPVALAIPDKPQLSANEATNDSSSIEEKDDTTSGSLNILSILFLMLIASIRALRSTVRYV